MSALASIVLQKSQNAVRQISRQNTKQAAIADWYSLKLVTEIAVSSSPGDVGPPFIRKACLQLRNFVISDAKRLLQQNLSGADMTRELL